MRLMTYLFDKHDGTWEVRIPVPKDCRERIGKSTLTKRLGRKTKSEANELAAPVIADFKARIRQARLPIELIDPSRAIAALECWRDVEVIRARTACFNTEPPSVDTSSMGAINTWLDGVSETARKRDQRRTKLLNGVGADDKAIIDALGEAGLHITATHPSMPSLRSVYCRAMLAVMDAEDAAQNGDFGKAGVLPSPPARNATTPVATPGKTVEDLIAAYTAAKSATWSESSKKATASVFRVLRDVFPGRQLSSITREDARALVGLLEVLPANLGKRVALKGLSVPKAVEKGRELGLPCIKPKTVNDGYLLHIASMWNWAVRETWIPSTPFSGLSVHDPVADEDRRDPFTRDQLKTLFRQGPWSRPWSADRADGGMFWVPLLCLFHGLRLGEAAALRTADVTDASGVPLLHVLPYMVRPLKTKGARGVLPVHSELIRMGFMNYVKLRLEAVESMLFPEGVTDAGGQVARQLGRDFVALVGGLNFEGRLLGMHSFRHNFEDRLREAELPERTALALARRAEPGSSRIYGAGLSARLKSDAMAKIVYPGLDLSHLQDSKEGTG